MFANALIVTGVLLFTTSFARPIARMCADPKPKDILGLALSEKSTFPDGVEIVADGKVKGYRFNPESVLLGVQSSAVLGNCRYFPAEFSVVVTFKSSSKRKDSEYIFTLLGPDRKTVYLALRLQRENLFFDFRDKTEQTSQTARMREARLSDGGWHTVVVTVVGAEVKFTLDCQTRVTSTLKNPFPSNFDIRNTRFHVASRRRKRNRFTGMLRQLKLVSGSDASYFLCSTQPGSSYPSWTEETKPKAPSVPIVEFDGHSKEPMSCNAETKGRFLYTSRTGQLELCEGTRWKRLAIAEERLDYVSDFGDLKTKSKTLDFEAFAIPGEGLFLAAANQGRDRDMDSTIYKWEGNAFRPYQNITTDSAQDWEYFQIGEEHFLACANQGSDERSPYARSVIYRWDPSKKKFAPLQYFRTFAAQSWTFFEIDGNHYVIVANYGGGGGTRRAANSDTRESSWLYIWDPYHRAFLQIQSIDTIGAVDFEYFEAGGHHYLALANSFDGVNSRIDSVIYRWDYSKFIPLQYIETIGAQDWEHFSIRGRHYLAVANYYDYREKTYVINSTIYQLSESGNRFDKVQDIETTGALDWEFFTVGRDSYLIAASSSDSNVGITNTIYRWQGMEHFVPVHSIYVKPSADWEKIKLDDGRQLLISANVKGKHSKILELITY